ncbi:hypothetical protein ACKKBG_A09095 [Auxenochlorella protothecoides x Auxenochlorella symbiontica]
MTSVGWSGLGGMGAGMASNLHEGLSKGIPGYQDFLQVFNRTSSKTTPLQELGAKVAQSIHDLADCRVVFSVSSNDASAEELFLAWLEGRTGECQPAAYIDCSTILPETSRRLANQGAARGVTFLACTVFGRPDVAAAGKLTALLAGGRAELRERLTPLVSTFAGVAVRNLGDDPGLSNAAKLTGNFLIGAQIELAAEFLTLGERLGVGTDDLLHVHSLISSVIAPKYAAHIVRGNYGSQGGFVLDLALKDIGHVRTLARDASCPVPIADLVFNSLLSARAQHGPDLDWSGIVLPVRRAAGLWGIRDGGAPTAAQGG